MKHSTLLEILYGDNLSEIINVLNKSIYAKNYEVKDEKQITVHTGFSFTLHTEKKWIYFMTLIQKLLYPN